MQPRRCPDSRHGTELSTCAGAALRCRLVAQAQNRDCAGATVHRYEDSRGVQECVETEPVPELGPWIAGYAGYREEAGAPVQRLETPSGGAVLVLSFGNPLAVSQQPRGAGLPTRPADAAEVVTSFAGGISDRPALTTHAGRQHGVQLRLGPLAVYALFGVPLDELGQHPGGVIGLAGLGAGDWGDGSAPPGAGSCASRSSMTCSRRGSPGGAPARPHQALARRGVSELPAASAMALHSRCALSP